MRSDMLLFFDNVQSIGCGGRKNRLAKRLIFPAVTGLNLLSGGALTGKTALTARTQSMMFCGYVNMEGTNYDYQSQYEFALC